MNVPTRSIDMRHCRRGAPVTLWQVLGRWFLAGSFFLWETKKSCTRTGADYFSILVEPECDY